MRSSWFSDNRDLVKWSALLHLAKRHQLRVIVQICFLNPHRFPSVTVNGTTLPVPPEVINHFRSVRSVEHLSSEVEIRVFDRPLQERNEYLKAALAYVAQFSGRPRAVFLDPDTGLAPKKPDATHVTEAEVREFWSALAPRDVLVLYQHQTNRNGSEWVEPKRKQFAAAIDISPSRVKVAKSESIARDVVFYYASKV